MVVQNGDEISWDRIRSQKSQKKQIQDCAASEKIPTSQVQVVTSQWRLVLTC